MTIPLSRNISDADNDRLPEVIMEEVLRAVKQIYPLKATGPDGMHVVFYQNAGM